jgi:transcriptional regulator with XRE-family HTH domain
VNIHEAIKTRRLALGLSHDALAKRIAQIDGKPKVAWQTVQQWEFKTAPKRTRLPAVAAALETTVTQLLAGTVADTPKQDAAAVAYKPPAVTTVLYLAEDRALYSSSNEPPRLPTAAALSAAVDALALALASNLQPNVRTDIADQLAKLAMRNGGRREQIHLLDLLLATLPSHQSDSTTVD